MFTTKTGMLTHQSLVFTDTWQDTVLPESIFNSSCSPFLKFIVELSYTAFCPLCPMVALTDFINAQIVK